MSYIQYAGTYSSNYLGNWAFGQQNSFYGYSTPTNKFKICMFGMARPNTIAMKIHENFGLNICKEFGILAMIAIIGN